VRLKTDENLPVLVAGLLRAAGHDVETADAEGLVGKPDPAVLQVCQTERRAFVTLDLGVADIRQYPPADYEGLIVLRPRHQSIGAIQALVSGLIPQLSREPLVGQLWIVEPGRIRLHG
jgi:hypothetical protein